MTLTSNLLSLSTVHVWKPVLQLPPTEEKMENVVSGEGGEGREESRRRKKNGRRGEGRGRDADIRIRQYHKPK